MVRNFSEYLKTAKQYEIVRATLEDVIRYNDVHPGVLDRLWQEANEGEHKGIDYDEFLDLLDKYGLYIQTDEDRGRNHCREIRLELRVYPDIHNKVACAKVINIPL